MKPYSCEAIVISRFYKQKRIHKGIKGDARWRRTVKHLNITEATHARDKCTWPGCDFEKELQQLQHSEYACDANEDQLPGRLLAGLRAISAVAVAVV